MRPGLALQDIHPAVQAGVNTGNLEALVALYAEDARMITPDRSVAEGLDAIRELWKTVLAMNATMTVQTPTSSSWESLRCSATPGRRAPATRKCRQSPARWRGEDPTDAGCTSSTTRSQPSTHRTMSRTRTTRQRRWHEACLLRRAHLAALWAPEEGPGRQARYVLNHPKDDCHAPLVQG
jgi:SnoaL-like domain